MVSIKQEAMIFSDYFKPVNRHLLEAAVREAIRRSNEDQRELVERVERLEPGQVVKFTEDGEEIIKSDPSEDLQQVQTE